MKEQMQDLIHSIGGRSFAGPFAYDQPNVPSKVLSGSPTFVSLEVFQGLMEQAQLGQANPAQAEEMKHQIMPVKTECLTECKSEFKCKASDKKCISELMKCAKKC